MVKYCFVLTFSHSLGICDCCDGSDEIDSLFPIACPNGCKDILHAFQRQTLTEYKQISSGLQAKSNLVNMMKRKKLREQQSYLSLLTEYEETEKLYFQMRIFLEKNEKNQESKMQFDEIRRRVLNCANEYLPVCDIFGDGVDSYIDDMALPFHLFGDNDEEEYLVDVNNGNQQIEDKEKSEQQLKKEAQEKSSQRDEIRRTTMTALQRISSSYCNYLESDVNGILIEETPRVHKSVQQYIAYMTSRGGSAEKKRQRSVEMIRKKNTLFGPYLDNGKAGHILAIQVLCEMVGIMISPLTVPMTLGYHAVRRFISSFWIQMRQCGSSLPDPKLCSEWKISLAKSLREGGVLSQVMDALDYSQYNFWIQLSKRWSPYTSAVQWYVTLIQQVPWYYYRYYFTSLRLPVKRDACTLREGIRVAKEEMAALKEKIESRKEEEKKKLNPVSIKEDDGCSDSEIRSPDGTCRRVAVVDYSPDGSWEALDGTCLEKDDGQYLYKVCLFQTVHQGSTRLGTYRGWGDHTKYPSTNVEKKRFGSKANSFWNRAVSGLVGGTGENSNATVEYSKQFYDGGDRCHNGVVRHTEIHFNCNTTSEITEVVEYEVS